MKNKTENFEEKEAQFIAKLILDRLKVEPENVSKIVLASAKCKKVLGEIEAIEDSWSFDTDSRAHSFGRKIEGETIRLWSVPKMTARVLKNLVLFAGSKSILEIGTSAGFSTIHLAIGAKENNGQVKTIENLPIKADMAKNNFLNAELDNIHLIEGNAEDVLPTLNEMFDFIFLDADKENFGKYFDILLPKLKVGSLIVADNINDFGHMMTDFLEKVSGTHFSNSRCNDSVISTHIAQLDNGLMIVRRIK